MEFTSEQIAKAKAAKTLEELISLAKENNIGLTDEEAKKIFDNWHATGEVSINELDDTAGGCGEEEPKYQSRYYCDACSYSTWIEGVHREIMTCPQCQVVDFRSVGIMEVH